MSKLRRWLLGDGNRVFLHIRTIEGVRHSAPVRPGQPSYSEQRRALLLGGRRGASDGS